MASRGRVPRPRRKPRLVQMWVLPRKDGRWRLVAVARFKVRHPRALWITPRRLAAWERAYREWYDRAGWRLAHSPEMWVVNRR